MVATATVAYCQPQVASFDERWAHRSGRSRPRQTNQEPTHLKNQLIAIATAIAAGGALSLVVLLLQ
jgi:hypothetical protein